MRPLSNDFGHLLLLALVVIIIIVSITVIVVIMGFTVRQLRIERKRIK